MKKRIIEQLADIERTHGVSILFACESGSRGWGFPSPDSDYDVRFIYQHNKTDYLKIDEPRQQLNFPINDELDINGWDIKKILRSLMSSNVTAFEWLQSPIIYRANPLFESELWQVCQHYFSQRDHIRHYVGIAKGALSTITDEKTIKIKKLFYILRPILSARWCLQKNQIAPMEFKPLLELLPAALQPVITELMAQKAIANEGEVIDVNPDILAFVTQVQQECSDFVHAHKSPHFTPDLLDALFIKLLEPSC